MASYELQHVLPRNFGPPRVNGLGEPESVPAYPILLPTLDQFTSGTPWGGSVRMIPSIMPIMPPMSRRRRRRTPVPGDRIYPVTPAGIMPQPPSPGIEFQPISGLSAYVASPTPFPLTATWGLGAYRPRSLAGLGACGCPSGQGTCSCGMGGLGEFDLGQITLPVVGMIDVKSVALVVGAFLLVRKLLGAGRKVRQYGVRAPVYRKAVEA